MLRHVPTYQPKRRLPTDYRRYLSCSDLCRRLAIVRDANAPAGASLTGVGGVGGSKPPTTFDLFAMFVAWLMVLVTRKQLQIAVLLLGLIGINCAMLLVNILMLG